MTEESSGGSARTVGLGVLALSIAYAIHRLTDPADEEYQVVKEMVENLEEDIEQEVENPEELPENQVEVHRDTWRSISIAEYNELSDEYQGEIDSPAEIEGQLEEESLDVQAMGWKNYASIILSIRERELAEELDEDSIITPEMWNFMTYGLGAIGVLGLAHYSARILEAYRDIQADNRSFELMADREFIEEVIEPEEVPEPYEPPEDVQDEPDAEHGDYVAEATFTEIEGEAPSEIATHISRILDIGEDATVEVTQGTVEILAQVTNYSEEWFYNRSNVELALIALAILAIGVAIVAPEPMTTGIGMALAGAKQTLTGIRVSTTALRPLVPQLQNSMRVSAGAV